MALHLRFQPLAILTALFCLLHPLAAPSQMYRWADEKGGVVYSNIRPADASMVRNFRVVMEEDKPSPDARAARQAAVPAPPPSPIPPDLAAQEAALAARAEALRREQALQDRVAILEREVQALAYQAPPPPPEPLYYTGALPAYGTPWGYSYSYVVPYVVVPFTVVSPAFRARGGSFRSPRFSPMVRPPRSAPLHVGGAFHSGSFGRGRR